MGKQLIPHGFDQGFRCLGIEYPEGILADHLEHRHHQHSCRHDPKMLSQIGKAADGIDRIHYESREVTLLAAQSAVHRSTDDLGLEHIRQSCHRCRQDGYQKVALGAFQELPQKRQLFPLLRTCFIGCHEYPSILCISHLPRLGQTGQNRFKDAKRAQTKVCALKKAREKPYTNTQGAKLLPYAIALALTMIFSMKFTPFFWYFLYHNTAIFLCQGTFSMKNQKQCLSVTDASPEMTVQARIPLLQLRYAIMQPTYSAKRRHIYAGY